MGRPQDSRAPKSRQARQRTCVRLSLGRPCVGLPHVRPFPEWCLFHTSDGSPLWEGAGGRGGKEEEVKAFSCFPSQEFAGPASRECSNPPSTRKAERIPCRPKEVSPSSESPANLSLCSFSLPIHSHIWSLNIRLWKPLSNTGFRHRAGVLTSCLKDPGQLT